MPVQTRSMTKKSTQTIAPTLTINSVKDKQHEDNVLPKVGDLYDNAKFLYVNVLGGICITFGSNYQGYISPSDLKLTKSELINKVLPDRLKNKKFTVELIRAEHDFKYIIFNKNKSSEFNGFYELKVV